MAKINSEIDLILKKYLSVLEGKGISIDEAYLFGSYANGNPDNWSDIDVAVISEYFQGNRFLDKEKIRGLNFAIDTRISVLPLNKESLDSFFYQHEIIKKGIRII